MVSFCAFQKFMVSPHMITSCHELKTEHSSSVKVETKTIVYYLNLLKFIKKKKSW